MSRLYWRLVSCCCWRRLTGFTAGGWSGSSARRRAASDSGAGGERRRRFVPTKSFYLFASTFRVAAEGPIAGPIIACQLFGWLPCLVWIALGVVIIGRCTILRPRGVQCATARHPPRDTREHLGSGAGRAMMAFIGLRSSTLHRRFQRTSLRARSCRAGGVARRGARFKRRGSGGGGERDVSRTVGRDGLVERYLRQPLWL